VQEVVPTMTEVVMVMVVVVVVVIRVPFIVRALHSQRGGAPEPCIRMPPDLNFPSFPTNSR
jgi:hypothetical protein